MEMLFVMGLLALNGFISWWNCKVAGSVWIESKKLGGYMRVLVWCGAIQAAIGFSSILIMLLAFGAYSGGYLDKQHFNGAMSLWYLLVIIPALGSGLIITIHSLREAWRTRQIGDIGVAAWNSFAQGYNMFNAASDVPRAFGDLGELFKGGDSDDAKAKMTALMLLIVVLAIVGGCMITAGLIGHYAKQSLPQPVAA